MSARVRSVVLFDLDGTLIDSSADIALGVDALLAEHRLPPVGEALVRTMIGDGAGTLVVRAFGARGVAEPPPDAVERFKELYAARCLERTCVYDGIPELLASLHARGRRLAVVTNKPQALTETILGGLGLSPRLAAIVGPERARERKPSPEHVRAALRLLGARAEDAVMVGDSSADILSGRGAGVATIGVTWGFRDVAELAEAGADVIVGAVPELAAALG